MTRIVAISGPAGCGKTTIAELASRRTHAALVDGDAVYGPLADLLAGQPTNVVRAAIQSGLAATAATIAAAGVNVLVVAPFTAERGDPAAWQCWATAAADGTDAMVELAWVRTPADVIAQRLVARGAARDVDKFTAMDDWIATASPETPPAAPHIALDGIDAEAAAQVLTTYLRHGPA